MGKTGNGLGKGITSEFKKKKKKKLDEKGNKIKCMTK